ncbi:MAG: hypothetical protein HY665_02025 [Chloroflexi bacterium]|nr:hypothetical protein [Chloroflexota bacterium]
MRYPGCEKAKAFKLFDQGKRPSQTYNLVKVRKHTLFNYYQQWKKEREEDTKKKRLEEERQQKLEEERKESECRQKEEMMRTEIEDRLRVQKRIELLTKHRNQRERVLELQAQMSTADNVDEVQRIGRIYTREYDRFRELTRKLYPHRTDEKSIEAELHRKQE